MLVRHLDGEASEMGRCCARTPRRESEIAPQPAEWPPFTFIAPVGFDEPRDSHDSQTPWSVFQDRSGGLPTESSLTASAHSAAGLVRRRRAANALPGSGVRTGARRSGERPSLSAGARFAYEKASTGPAASDASYNSTRFPGYGGAWPPSRAPPPPLPVGRDATGGENAPDADQRTRVES